MSNPELPRTNGMCLMTQPTLGLFEPFHLFFSLATRFDDNKIDAFQLNNTSKRYGCF